MSDDDNPMHKIGHGRGDDTLMQTTKIDTTVAMEVVEVLTVKDVIARLIEPHTQAWKDLPKSVRDAMLDRPQSFQLRVGIGAAPDIVYNGTVWRHWNDKYTWSILNILK